VARQREANGLKAEQFSISDAAILEVIRSYTREAGCRNLERELGSVARHAATQIASAVTERVEVDASDLRAILGPVRFENELALRLGQPGVATGLAWTPVGGEILFVEATKMPGRGELILTGQLGDVMKESARAAISLVKTNAVALGIDPALFEKHDIHIHVPAGAIPKDGPSAGVALTTALVSLLVGKPVKHDTAMTGEISLRGLVLPVGGIKEKVLAARRAGIKTVCLPARNEKDFEDIPEDTRKAMKFLWLSDIDQVLREALGIRELKLKPGADPIAPTGRISASPEAPRASI
jgi:ATP-dependent Lon protease